MRPEQARAEEVSAFVLRIFLYLLPAIMDVVVGCFFFVATVRMAESGATAMAVGNIFTVWGVTYMASAMLVGKVVTAANCSAMMLLSCAAMALCSVLTIVFPDLVLLYFFMMLFGGIVGIFFPSFMVFMKAFESGRSRGLAYSTSIYTMSWSLGLAAGPFVAGYVWTALNWQWCMAMNLVLAAATGVGVVLLRPHAHSGSSNAVQNEPDGNIDYSRMPNMVRQAWTGLVVCLLTLSAAKALYPSSAAALNIPKSVQGSTLALICFGQALVAFFLRNGRTWMYRPMPVIAFGIVGATSLVLFGFSRTPALFALAAALLGVYGGAFFIHAAFHALVHPSKAGKYVGVNESVVGFTGIVGPFSAGLLADVTTLNTAYLCAAGLALIVIILQALRYIRSRIVPGNQPQGVEGS